MKIFALISPVISLVMSLVISGPAFAANWPEQAIKAIEARELTRQESEVIVAVIDTGAEIAHPALQGAFWVNSGEIPGNGIDDDANGFIDDVNGWNFVGGNANLRDHHGHGTHISGIIGARQGLAKGVAQNAKLMILKYYDPKDTRTDTVKSTVAAIRYAVKMGARVINYSAGGRVPSEQERSAIEEAGRKGVLFIAAAGNESFDVDHRGYYPAAYALPNLLSVTAVDSQTQVLSSSNFGARSITLGAPGKEILSATPGGRYARMTGTSQATAFATGVAALLLGQETMSPEQLIRILSRTARPTRALAEKTQARGLLDAFRALTMKEEGLNAVNSAAIDRSFEVE